jgi:hypothetical protein
MSTWNRIDRELTRVGKDWKWLALQLGVTKVQTYAHWEARGVPAKYHLEIMSILKVSQEWLKGEPQNTVDDVVARAGVNKFALEKERRRPLHLSELLAQLAVLLDAVDGPTRDNAALMLSSFANKPEGRASSASSLLSMLEPDTLKKGTPAQQQQSLSSGAR